MNGSNLHDLLNLFDARWSQDGGDVAADWDRGPTIPLQSGGVREGVFIAKRVAKCCDRRLEHAHLMRLKSVLAATLSTPVPTDELAASECVGSTFAQGVPD